MGKLLQLNGVIGCNCGRFETQEDTGKHLAELQNRAEKEIR